jgi:hypothetical protein
MQVGLAKTTLRASIKQMRLCCLVFVKELQVAAKKKDINKISLLQRVLTELD